MTNSGLGPATIGNIVANLQLRSGKTWVTRVSDVADATQGDGAASALIDRHASSEGLGRFSEGPGSGTLHLMDAAGNSLFSRTEEPTIAPGATVSLLFSAAFDNAVLNLANGTRVRLEVLVSFGNAARAKGCTASLDINGNGTIDADEAWVRSLAARTGLAVPPPRSATAEPVLADSAADIATTGTVTYSDPVFDLGATEGSVSVQVDGGATGGTITNCAHLTAPATTTTVGGHVYPNGDDLSLDACDTQDVGATPVCTPGAPGCGWHDGDVITYSQLNWGEPSSEAGALLTSFMGTVYASTFGAVSLGLTPPGYSMTFSDTTFVFGYLPATGTPAALTSNLLDPTTNSAGSFGSQVLALELNVDFAAAGVTAGAAGVAFGDLTLCSLTTFPALNGMSVRQFLGVVNTLLGGGSGPYVVADLDPVLADLNRAFPGGLVSTFAQDHVVHWACP